jgi:CelD/BcsL family acetyltransferase involved in cellulose biosynthesis
LAPCYAIRVPQNAAAYVSSLGRSTRKEAKWFANKVHGAFGEELRFELGFQPYLDHELAEALIGGYSHRRLQKFREDVPDKRKRFLLDVLTSGHGPNSIFYSTLKLREKIVAENVGFFCPATKRSTVLLLAYDSSYSRFELGNYLLSLTVQSLADARTGWRPDIYDLTRGNELYKVKYGGNLSLNHRFVLTAMPVVYRQYVTWDAALDTMRSTWSFLRSLRRAIPSLMRSRAHGPE